MKYNNPLLVSLIIILIFTVISNVNADELKAVVTAHSLILTPSETEIISGEDAVIDIEIQNTFHENILIKLDVKDIPESWISYERQLFDIDSGAIESTKLKIHIPEGRIGSYNIKIIAKNLDTNIEVIKILKIEALPPKDKGMSGIPIFPLAEQPILLLLDIIANVISGIFG